MADDLQYFIPRTPDVGVTPSGQPVYDDAASDAYYSEPEGAQFSYEQDILPLKQLAFRATQGLPAEQRQGSYEQLAAQADAAYERRMKLTALETQERNRRVAYDTARFNLGKAKEDAAKELQMQAQLQPFLEQLQPIITDPNSTQEDVIRNLSLFGVQNAQTFAQNKVAAAAFNNALRSVQGFEQRERGVNVGQVLNATGFSPAASDVIRKELGESVTAKQEIPLDLVGRAVAAAEKEKTARALSIKQSDYVRQRTDAMRNRLFQRASAAKLQKDTVMNRPDVDKFADAADEPAVMQVINSYGSEEQQQAAASGNAETKIQIANAIIAAIENQTYINPNTPPEHAASPLFR